MTISTARKVRAVATGAVTSGAETAVGIGALNVAGRVLAVAAPRVALGVARVAGTVFGAVPLAIATGTGAIYGGVKAYRHGERGLRLATSTLEGGASLGTNVLADAYHAVHDKPAGMASGLMPEADMKAAAERSMGMDPKGGKSREQRAEELGKPFGGTPEDLKLAIENERRSMKTDKEHRDWHERRAIAMEEALEARKAKAEAAAAAAQPKPEPKKGLVQNAYEKVVGESGPKPEDALSKQRKQLEESISQTAARMKEEYSGRGGAGPKYDKLKKEHDEAQGKLDAITKQQNENEKAELASYNNLGSLLGGAGIGTAAGALTKRAAKAAAKVAGHEIEKLASVATTAVNKAPKSVIHGTVEGDKAAAAVNAARAGMAKPVISKAAALAFPTVMIGHGVAVTAWGLSSAKDDPTRQIKINEGSGAIAAGIFSMKGALAARAMRAAVGHHTVGKLEAAAGRLAREARSGPAGVAVSRGRRLDSVARGKAQVASEQAGRKIAIASGAKERAVITAAAKTEATRTSSKVNIVNAGTSLAIAKQRGTNQIERVAIEGKASNTRAIARNNNATPGYKDVWQDKRGRVYHRKDTSIRKGANRGGVANDNTSRSRRSS